jgi:hypothetical protein
MLATTRFRRKVRSEDGSPYPFSSATPMGFALLPGPAELSAARALAASLLPGHG